MPIESALPQINQRRNAFNKNKRRLPPKQPVWLYPRPIERFYDKALQARIDIQEELIKRSIITNLPSIAQERNLEVTEAFRADAFADSVDRLMQAVRLGFTQGPVNTKTLSDTVGSQTNTWNDKEWSKQLNAAFGVDIFQREPFVTPALNSFTRENVQLISKMDADMLDSIEGVMQRGFRSGQSSANIAKEIAKRVDVTRAKARFIARDQVGKLNGQLTGLRQNNLGIKSYTWRTSDDERVRTTHKVKDDSTFQWDQPPAGTGHPGNDFQCRCYAEPNFESVFEELEA